MGDRFDVSSETENQGKQDGRPQYSGEPGPSARPDVDHRAKSSTRTGQAAYHACNRVSYALSHQLPVRAVLGSSDGVGYQGGKQTINGAEQREDKSGLNGAGQQTGVE